MLEEICKRNFEEISFEELQTTSHSNE